MQDIIQSSPDLSTGRILLIDKPLRWTSFDAVHRVKRQLLQEVLKDIEDNATRKTLKRKLKVGHAGTLDPLATGLLIVCTGPMTKKILAIQSQEKEYTGTITLGAVTPTYDLESTPEKHQPIAGITEDQLQRAVQTFTGTILQLPPAHSAVKVDGQRAYTLARKGKEVHIQPKEVNIKLFEINIIDFPTIEFKVICSKGTYIRSLAHDLGQFLGCGAYLSSLRRTRIGEFNVEKAVQPGSISI
jgi:tRNA pseudouridine55 synthase